VKLSAFVSLIVGFPLIAVQIWLFVAPGLYRRRSAFLPFLVATPFMFYAGCAVMYYVVLPYVINLMLAHYVPPDIEKTLRASDYLSRILQLVFASASPSRCRCC
jgi:Sec-independent protein secretion pathway component TatC